MELMARVEALLRRTKKRETCLEVYRFGQVTLNFKKFEAYKNDEPVPLSPREFKILKYLIEHRGEVVSRDQLLDVVWGYDNFPLTRTVDMHIAKLRQKIEDSPNDPRFIVTLHRVGYKFTG
jgi:two-component system alkaline phosphatase synthesis response regulator PhoP